MNKKQQHDPLAPINGQTPSLRDRIDYDYNGYSDPNGDYMDSLFDTLWLGGDLFDDDTYWLDGRNADEEE